MFFIALRDSNMFLSDFGLTDDFEKRMCFNNVAVALSFLEFFCDSHDDFVLEDFVMFLKCEVY